MDLSDVCDLSGVLYLSGVLNLSGVLYLSGVQDLSDVLYLSGVLDLSGVLYLSGVLDPSGVLDCDLDLCGLHDWFGDLLLYLSADLDLGLSGYLPYWGLSGRKSIGEQPLEVYLLLT